jgi:hypothetical protein
MSFCNCFGLTGRLKSIISMHVFQHAYCWSNGNLELLSLSNLHYTSTTVVAASSCYNLSAF